MSDKSKIEFSSSEKNIIAKSLQDYFDKELDQELGNVEAQFLLDFITDEIGSYFYNRGIYDAQAILEQRMENITDAVYALEKPTKFYR